MSLISSIRGLFGKKADTTNIENFCKPDSQAGQILAYMKKGNTITSLEAYNLFGCTRLASRIVDITRKLGYAPSRRRIQVKNREGKDVWVMQYYL